MCPSRSTTLHWCREEKTSSSKAPSSGHRRRRTPASGTGAVRPARPRGEPPAHPTARPGIERSHLVSVLWSPSIEGMCPSLYGKVDQRSSCSLMSESRTLSLIKPNAVFDICSTSAVACGPAILLLPECELILGIGRMKGCPTGRSIKSWRPTNVCSTSPSRKLRQRSGKTLYLDASGAEREKRLL
jgi:hypothetical protein